MATKREFGFRSIVRWPLLRLEWVGSWDRKSYPRFGHWRVGGTITLRWRAYLLHLGRP
jgi:hypothetical protein